MLDSIYQMILKLLKNRILRVKTSILRNVKMDIIT